MSNIYLSSYSNFTPVFFNRGYSLVQLKSQRQIWRSLVYKKKKKKWPLVFKLGYVFCQKRGRIPLLSLNELREKSQGIIILGEFVNKP